MPDRAVLEPARAEAERLHRGSWKPDRREPVPLAALDNDVTADPVAVSQERNRLDDQSAGKNAEAPATATHA